MIWLTHILSGAALASKINPPALGLTLAFLSHFFLDFLPHYEYSTKNIQQARWHKSLPEFLKIALDGSLGFLIVIALAQKPFLALAGGLLAISPDWLTLLHHLLPKNSFLNKLYQLHPEANHYFQNKKVPTRLIILTQLLVLILSFWLLIS